MLEKRSIVNRWLKQHFLIWDSVLWYAENIQKHIVSWIGAERHTSPHSFKTFTFKRMFAILVNYLNVIIPYIETNTISTCRISAKCVIAFKQASQYNPHQGSIYLTNCFLHSCSQNTDIFLSWSYLGDLQRLLLLLATLQSKAPRRPSSHSNADVIPCAHFPGAVRQHSFTKEHEKFVLQMFSEPEVCLPGRAGDPEHHTVAAAAYCTSKCSHSEECKSSLRPRAQPTLSSDSYAQPTFKVK